MVEGAKGRQRERGKGKERDAESGRGRQREVEGGEEDIRRHILPQKA